MLTTLNIYKPLGKTPLETIELLRQKLPEYQNKKITYAGRLDPMAEGVLLLLVEPETNNRETYLHLPKEYECEALFGFSSDTFDILGIPQKHEYSKPLIESIIPTLLGKQIQPYPPYSSVPVQGKPLFYWARQGKLNKIVIPKKEIEIFNISVIKKSTISSHDLLSRITASITLVQGDFRQSEILQTWENLLTNNQEQHAIIHLSISCSSGTYVRGIVNTLGEKSGVKAVTLGITRTRVGNFMIDDSVRLAQR